MKKEIELKLHIKQADIQKLFTLDLIKSFAHTHKKQHVMSTYFDTSELDLANHDIALRVREIDGQYWQTIKAAGEVVDGLSSRNEWEYPLSSNQPNVERLPVDFALELTSYEKRWLPIFTTDFVRDSWQLTLSNHQHIELAVDVGRIYVDAKWQEPICEMELEIIEGKEAEGLISFAKLLKKDLDLKPFDQSKAARGYRLFQLAHHAI